MGRLGPAAILILCVGLAASPGYAALDARLQSALLAGADLMLNKDLDEAEVAFREAARLPEGELPAAYYQATLILSRAEDKEEEEVARDMDLFLNRMAEVIARAEKLHETRPKDADLALLLGAAWGSKAFVDGLRKNYLASLRGLRSSRKYLEEALALDPGLTDAYYWLGLYDYSWAKIPAVLRPLVHLVLPGGDKRRGLDRLRLAAEQGTFTRAPARLALAQIYAYQEENFEEARAYIERVAKRYPGNPDFAFLLAFIYSELGRFEEAVALGREIFQDIEAGRNHYDRGMQGRYEQLMGKIYMDRGDYATALTFFRRSVQADTRRYAWVTAWAWTRMGMVYDLLGNREAAKENYRKALAIEAPGIARDFAKKYLAQPYRGEKPARLN